MCSTGRKPVQANHLRVLLLVINLTLGATLPFVYAWSMSSASTGEPHPSVLDLDDYIYRPLPELPAEDWSKLSEQLTPERPRSPGPPSRNPVDPPRPPDPLGEEWRYVFYMRTDDGRVNLVKLERIQKAPAPSPRSGRSLSSRSRRPTGRSTLRRAPKTADSVVLFVLDRVVRDPAFGIEFLIDYADGKTFDYVLPADPTTVYSLPFAARDSKLSRRSTEDDSPKAERHFVPAGWREMVESEYRRWKNGEIEFSEAKTLNP